MTGLVGTASLAAGSTAALAASAPKVTSVVGGGLFASALKSDGTVWGWGLDWSGQLGNGANSTQTLTPGQVSGLTGVTAIAGGQNSGYALKSDGTVWAWGADNSGELGDGQKTNTDVPVQVSGLTGVTAIAAGSRTAYALKSDGTVWAWGFGSDGELGNGSFASSDVPVQVSGLTGVTAIAGGWVNAYALKSDGTVWAWGWGADGATGSGHNAPNSDVPVQVQALQHVTAIAAGNILAFALESDGTVWAWGYDGGRLGSGTFSTGAFGPIQVSGLTGVTAIAAGKSSGYALKSDGTVWAWGHDQWGQLGNGSTTNSDVPVQVSGLTGVTAIAACEFDGFALKSDGTVWAWGGNNEGELGSGKIGVQDAVPTQVQGLSATAAAQSVALTIGSTSAHVGSQTTSLPVAPVIVSSRTFVPLRFVSQALGASVSWDATSRSVTITENGVTVVMTEDRTAYTVNGGSKTMDAAPFIAGAGYTMVPVRFVSQALGFQVAWNPALQQVTITLGG